MRKIGDFIIDTTSIIATIVFVFMTLPQLLFLSMPGVTFFSTLVLILPDPRFLSVGWICVMSALGLSKKAVDIHYRMTDPQILALYHTWFMIASIVLTYLSYLSFGIVHDHLSLRFLLPVFFYILLAWTFSLLSRVMSRISLVLFNPNESNLHYWKAHKGRYIGAIILFWTIMPATLVILYKTFSPGIRHYLLPYVRSIILAKRSPHIISLSPQLVYPSTIITLRGENFGWLENPNDSHNRVVIGNRTAPTGTWTEKEIALAIPLELRPGVYDIYIRAHEEYNGTIHEVQSNHLKITVLSRTDGWDESDDRYFQQFQK